MPYVTVIGTTPTLVLDGQRVAPNQQASGFSS